MARPSETRSVWHEILRTAAFDFACGECQMQQSFCSIVGVWAGLLEAAASGQRGKTARFPISAASRRRSDKQTSLSGAKSKRSAKRQRRIHYRGNQGELSSGFGTVFAFAMRNTTGEDCERAREQREHDSEKGAARRSARLRKTQAEAIKAYALLNYIFAFPAGFSAQFLSKTLQKPY